MKVVGRTIVLFVLAAALLKVEGQGSSSSDQQALIRFKTSLSDPKNALSSWDANLVDPCTWFHVTCNNANRVTRLSLGDNMLNGEIPSQLGNLKNLIAMDLYNNALRGSIPSSFGSNLQSLLFLRVQNNKLSGQIPNSLTTIPKLSVLDISNNRLCGIAPIRLLLVKTLRIGGNPGLGHACPRQA
ncbi:Leucine-rich repeat protein 1 [Linum perenne]